VKRSKPKTKKQKSKVDKTSVRSLSSDQRAHARPIDRGKRTERISTKNAGRDPITGQNIPYTPTEESTRKIRKLARRGATCEEIAVIMNLRPGQVRMHHGAMIDRALALITLKIEEAIQASARGTYNHPDVHIAYPNGKRAITHLRKFYPPSAAAQRFWTLNRQPGHRTPGPWQDDVVDGAAPPDDTAAAIRDRLAAMEKVDGSGEKD
jgi:hypothetical protein